MYSPGSTEIEEISLSGGEIICEPELVVRSDEGSEDDGVDHDVYDRDDDCDDDDGVGDYMTPEAVDEFFLDANIEDEGRQAETAGNPMDEFKIDHSTGARKMTRK